MGDPDVEHLGRVATLDRNLLAYDFQRAPLVFEQVAVALDALDEKVLDVSHDVGEGPADIVVLAHVNAWHSRQRGAAHEATVEAEANLVPDARHARRQVRVAGDQWVAGGAELAGNGPVVGTAGLGREPDRSTYSVDLLDDRQAVSRPDFLGNDRIVGWIGGIEAGGELGAERALHVRAQQLPLPDGREGESQQPAAGQD